MTTGAWVHCYAARPRAALRLFCFSYAGAGASVYRLWHTGLPSDIEVCAIQLPGREGRLRETPITSLPEMVASLLPALSAQADRPFAFFGHSMGAALAAETARTLQQRGDPVPDHLFLSGRRPAHIVDPDPPIAQLPDAAFVAELNRRYGGIPAEVLAHDDLMALLLPGLRADITALEGFRPAPGPRLSMPLSVFGGLADTRTPRAHLDAWRAEAAGPVRVRQFPGDHFFLNPQRAALLDALRAELAPLVDGALRSAGPA